ncbi:MAG: hypothetical protein AAFX10_02950 [Pseudomonadota bacterium]
MAVERFIESQRTERNGPGKILASVYGFFDEDSHPDRLVVYTYEHGPNRGDKAYKIFVAGFLAEGPEATDVLVIDESEMVSDAFRSYSFDGSALVIRGDKRLPSDSMCCPSAIASITLSVVDDRVEILNSE